MSEKTHDASGAGVLQHPSTQSSPDIVNTLAYLYAPIIQLLKKIRIRRQGSVPHPRRP